MDVKSAFRLLLIHLADRHLLAMNWNAQIFIDTCLPFGLRSVPKLFNILADLISWILEQKGVYPLLHYLDDFLLISSPKFVDPSIFSVAKGIPRCEHTLRII